MELVPLHDDASGRLSSLPLHWEGERMGENSLLHARKGEAKTDGIMKEGIRPPRRPPPSCPSTAIRGRCAATAAAVQMPDRRGKAGSLYVSQ